MQPTLPQTTGAADMDLPAVQSMDWLFKKERIYLLAQFWQQRATLAEKEVNTLKEQLSGTNLTSPTTTTTTSLSSPTAVTSSVTGNTPTSTTNLTQTSLPNKISTNLNSNSKNSLLHQQQQFQQHQQQQQQNGLASPSPPLSDSGSTASNNCISSSGVNLNNLSSNSKLFLNNNKMDDASNMITAMTADMKLVEQMHPNEQKVLNNNSSSNINNNNNRSVTPSDKDVECASNNNNNNNNSTSNNNSSSKTLADELAAKDREIKALIDEVTRLQALHESHIVQIQRLEERLEAKRQHILRLEARLEKQTDLQDAKKENNNLRSLDMSSPAVAAAAAAAAAVASESKQFQELLFERTKALAAAQSEALNKSSSNADGSSCGATTAATALAPAVVASATTSSCHAANEPSGGGVGVPAQSQAAASAGTPPGGTGTGTSTVSVKSASASPSSVSSDTIKKFQTSARARSATSTPFRESPKDGSVSSPQLLTSNFQNVEQFGSFLGEEIVSNWRRGYELPPPPPQLLPSMAAAAIATSATTTTTTPIPFQQQSSKPPQIAPQPPQGPSTTALLSQLVNSTFSNSLKTDTTLSAAAMSNSHQDVVAAAAATAAVEKGSVHHETSSTASTPNLQDGRSVEEHMNGSSGGGLTPMSLSMVKAEDNNNTLGPLPHVPTGFLPGLPFQFQDRGHFRFAEDLQLPPGSMAGRLGESLIPKGDPMEAKLQEMLRYNMDKYANQNLDTLHISRRVRELLSVHNIGQRLFAKYILGLSQGTVSELLSKPKPWDKLTEKGRDSYRKMHAWGCDDNAVLLLKSLIPKKAKDSGMPQYGRNEDPMNEDRIAHILSEASNLMKTPQSQSMHHQQQQQQQQVQQQHQQHQQQQHMQQAAQHLQNSQQQSAGCQEDTHSNEDSKSPHNHSPSPFYKEALQRRLKGDEMSQDKVARIYQEELAKLMSRTPRDAFPSGGMPPAAAAAATAAAAANQMPDENIRMALEAYHRELAKLQQTGGALPNFPNLPGLLALQQQALNGAQDLSVPKEKSMKVNGQQQNSSGGGDHHNDQNAKDNSISNEDALRHSSAFSLVRPKQEPGTPVTSNASTNSTATASPLGNSILPPAMTPNDDFSAAASPLQRMASITNSLITQPPVTPHHSTPQRPMKAVLPPITQQQFDMFNNLNTEEIVRRVKEALSQYSISQRLFGESVLGLSQGSVSDLLARPKPWHMLTQKGREPFIRMKMFLEDENAVHKLVASQYKIAPEKLMRTGNYSGSPQIPPGLNNKMVPMQKMMNDLKMEPQHLMQMQAAAAMNHIPTSQHQQGMLLTPPGLPPHHAINLPSNEKKPMLMPMHSPQQNNAMRNMHHMSPTVYEMAALTHDLDTQVITTKIKEALLANNIGQKIFGEAVLGLSQGSVSELLSKPKPWHMLSIKGREPFIRMQLWLSDANNVERLQALKNERREASKRRRSTGPGTQDNSSDTSSNDTADFYASSPGPGSVGSAGAPPNKKQRVLFSEEQKEALRLAFALDPYPNVATIEFLASELGLATRTITNWFHNHRMRLKQQVPHGAPNEPVPSRENQSGTPFDPVQFRILLNQRLMELQKERMGLSGVPLPYPPYFAANPNLAALIGRGLLPTGEPDLAALNNAFKEQMSGLDLSMSSLKREREEEFEDVDGEGDSHVSDSESVDGGDMKPELKETPTSIPSVSRISRRKPVAPQWVNPDWQDTLKGAAAGAPSGPIAGPVGGTEQEVIINGVCVMQQQAADYSRKAGSEETVRIEPAPVQDRFQDDGDDDATSDNEDDDARGDTESQMSNKNSDCGETNENDDNDGDGDVSVKQEDCESTGRRSVQEISDSGKPDDDETPGVWTY